MGDPEGRIGHTSGSFSALCVVSGMDRGYVVVISMRFYPRMNIVVRVTGPSLSSLLSVIVYRTVGWWIWATRVQRIRGVIARTETLMPRYDSTEAWLTVHSPNSMTIV